MKSGRLNISSSSGKRRYGWGNLRRIVQSVAFLGFLILIMSARYPVNPEIYHNALVKFSPFTQLFLAMRQAGNNPSLLLLIVIVLIFAFTGRGFCGWLCPVGTGLDVYNRLVGKRFRRKNRDVKTESLRWKYNILIASIICLVFGVSLYWLLDPTAMFTRNTALVVAPVIDTTARETTRALSGLPNVGYEIEKAMRTVFNPLPVRSLYFWFFLGLLIFIFLLEIFALRFFCKVICPLGGFLGYLSNFSFIRLRIDDLSCISCNRCIKACKTSAMSSKDKLSIDNRECVLCLACIEACEYTGLSVRFEKLSFVRNSDNF
ncbi:MAG: 4Fe-4S binding protein, partial [bacterium]